jgi:hypothetical protein
MKWALREATFGSILCAFDFKTKRTERFSWIKRPFQNHIAAIAQTIFLAVPRSGQWRSPVPILRQSGYRMRSCFWMGLLLKGDFTYGLG